MQDHKALQGLPATWVQQALQVQSASLVLAGQMALLAATAPMAWLALLDLPVLKESPAQRALREAPARTARLVRRGIPEPLARQGLKAL